MNTENTHKILVIDDDVLVAKTLKKLLEKSGFSVFLAHNAIEGIDAAKQVDYDLVISDIRMPGQSGILAIKGIKENYEKVGVNCGYIFISGYTEEDTPEHAVKLGVNKFIFKPFDNEKLLASVNEELELVSAKKKLLSLGDEKQADFTVKVKKKVQGARRVVITGFGSVAPSGIGKEAYWNGLRQGANCIDEISFFDNSEFSSKAAAEIRDFDPVTCGVEKSEMKRMGRSSHLAVSAANLCLKDAGFEVTEENSEELGVVLGSAVSGLEYVEKDFRSLEKRGPKKVRPYLGIAGFGGAISSEISRALGLRGTSLTLSTGCTSSTDAMGYAFDMISSGKSDLLFTGGADACVTPGILAAFCQMGAVSTWTDNLKKASRPFNKDRDGFVIGEGAWVFTFEELAHALDRGATIYGEVKGYASTCDAWHMAKPHPSGTHTARAIAQALAVAGIDSQDVDLFEAYGNGTPVNDSYETGVVKRVFGKHAYNVCVPSIKSMLGHPLGASGAQQVGAAMLAFQENVVHPTINYEVPDPECDLNYVPNEAEKKEVDVAVCSSIAFGAKNAAIILQDYKD